MARPKRQQLAWNLLVGGCLTVSLMFAISFITAPWDVWAGVDSAYDGGYTLADMLEDGAIIITLMLVVVTSAVWPPYACRASAIIPFPFLVATYVWVEMIIKTNPEMNMAGVALMLPFTVYVFAFFVAIAAKALSGGAPAEDAG